MSDITLNPDQLKDMLKSAIVALIGDNRQEVSEFSDSAALGDCQSRQTSFRNNPPDLAQHLMVGNQWNANWLVHEYDDVNLNVVYRKVKVSAMKVK